MRIIYLTSVITLFVGFILTKKTEKSVNVLESSFVSIVILFCYNSLICYVLTFFAILNKLWILSLINIMISAMLFLNIVRKKEIQKFLFDKTDMIFIIITLLIIIGISYINFGFPFNVNYETGDPSVHYLTAVEFAEEEILLPGVKNEDFIYGRLASRRTVSYVNSGLLMKSLSKSLDTIVCYNIFVIFGMFTLFLTAMIAYFTLKKFARKREYNIFAMIISLIFILGYPLNSFLFGFEYLSMGILIICAIIDIIYYINNNNFEKKNLYIVLFLLNFGLFSSYYMFVPFMYPAEWIYFCIKNYKHSNKLITKDLLITLLMTLLIPFILGYIYHLMPDLYAIIINKNLNINSVGDYSKFQVSEGFAVNGYSYINKYSNMIVLIPLCIYYFIKEKKDNKLFDFLLLIGIIIFLSILYIGYSLERVSIYYISKNYYILWLVLIYCNFKALIILNQKYSYRPIILITAYIILIIIELLFSKVKMNGNEKENKYENIFEVAQVFAANKNILQKKDIELNQKEIEILLYARNNLDYNKKIEVVSDAKQYFWSYVILRYVNEEEDLRYSGQNGLTMKVVRLEEKLYDVDYMIYFNRSINYKYYFIDKMFNDYETVYENEAGGIIKYNR